MKTLTKDQQSLIVAVLCQRLMKAYRLLAVNEHSSGNTLTEMGRRDIEGFASELRDILLELGMPLEVIELIRSPNNLSLGVEV